MLSEPKANSDTLLAFQAAAKAIEHSNNIQPSVTNCRETIRLSVVLGGRIIVAMRNAIRFLYIT
jgi:hypothetical protein